MAGCFIGGRVWVFAIPAKTAEWSYRCHISGYDRGVANTRWVSYFSHFLNLTAANEITLVLLAGMQLPMELWPVGYKGPKFWAERYAVAMVSNAEGLGYMGTHPHTKSGAHLRKSTSVGTEWYGMSRRYVDIIAIQSTSGQWLKYNRETKFPRRLNLQCLFTAFFHSTARSEWPT